MSQTVDVEEQYDKIYRYCYFKLRSWEAAEDVTQEAFLRFLGAPHPAGNDVEDSNEKKDCNGDRRSGDLDGSGRGLPYLYVIARNLCMDEFRRRRLENHWEREATAGQGTETDCAEAAVENMALTAALSKLSDEERELILLRYVNEVPFSVISEMLHISRFAVRRKLKKALLRLRSMLE